MMVRLDEMLAPGETVLYRAAMPPDAGWVVFLWAFFVGSIAADAMYRYPPEDVGDALVMLGYYFLPIFIVPVAIVLAIMWVRFPAWAITERRVLLRRGLLGAGHDEMARHDIGTCLYDKAGGRIVLTGGDRELTIACNQRQAGCAVAVLGSNDHGEALA